MAYQARPLMCRSAFSTSKLSCQLAHENPEEEVPIPMPAGPRLYAEEQTAGILVGENKSKSKGKTRFIEEWIIKLFKK
jgi:hypothetical protein